MRTLQLLKGWRILPHSVRLQLNITLWEASGIGEVQTRSHLNVRNPVRNWQNPCCPVRLLRTCKRVKVTVWEHIFVCASLCGWAVLFSLEIFNFLQTNHPLPPPQLSLSFPLLWSNCYLNVSTWLLFWKKMMYYIYNKLLYIE